MYSRCIELLEFRDGLRFLAGHEPINDKTDNQGEEEEVQVAEKRLLFVHHGLGVGGGLRVHICHVDTLHWERTMLLDQSHKQKKANASIVMKHI